MALQDASVHKTTTDGVAITSNPLLSGAILEALETKIAEEAAKTDVKTYRTAVDFKANINGRATPVDVIGSDESTVPLDDIVRLLGVMNYGVSYRLKPKAREGGQDRVCITVSWS